MKIKQYFSNTLLAVLAILNLFQSTVFADETLDSLIQVGKEQIYRLEFREAQENFRLAQQSYPQNPHGYIFEAYVNALVFGMDQSNDSLLNVINEQVEKALEIAENFKDRDDNNPQAYFYLALGNGIDALTHVVNRSFIKGYWSGRKTKSNLEKAVKIDPFYYDAYFGLGLFHYYADLLPGMLKFIAGILGFEGDRVRGKNEVYMAASRGTVFRIEGEFVYHSIGYFLEGDKSSSIRAMKQLYRRYPTNNALGLIIAYHYRRSGYLQKCIEYCENLDDRFSNYLPQLTNVRYYNMGVCYFDLNEFEKADSVFQALEELPTRKSKYYQSATRYYRGLLADLRFDRDAAVEIYAQIPNEKQTQYWYFNKLMHERFPMDSLQFRYFQAENYLNSRQFNKSLDETEKLLNDFRNGAKSTNPFADVLTELLMARQYHYGRKMDKADVLFTNVMNNVKRVDDELQYSWIHIHYGRYLRSAKQFEEAISAFEKANNIDDDFTKIICEREVFLTKREWTEHNSKESE